MSTGTRVTLTAREIELAVMTVFKADHDGSTVDFDLNGLDDVYDDETAGYVAEEIVGRRYESVFGASGSPEITENEYSGDIHEMEQELLSALRVAIRERG